MEFFGKVSKNKAYEIIIFTKAWDCVIDISLSWTVGRKHDHAGLRFYIVLFGYKLIEFEFHDVRHAQDNEEVD